MTLNHINLCSSDVDALAAVLTAHFDYRLVDAGHAPGQAPGSTPGSEARYAVVVGADASELVITSIEPVPDGGSAYPRGIHVGLVQDSREAVLAKHAELLEAGLEPGEVSDGFEVWGATWTAFYCPVGDGLEIEVNHRTPSALLDGPGPQRSDSRR